MGYPLANWQVEDTAGGGVDTSRVLSAALWGNSLTGFYGNGSLTGRFEFEDFHDFFNTTDASSANGWFIQDGTDGGTAENFSSTNSPTGEVVLSATTGTDDFGIEAHSGGAATIGGKFVTFGHDTLARGRAGYEVRLDPASAVIWFAGWSEPLAVFLTTTSALPTSDYCGFFRATTTGDVTFVTRKGSVTDSAIVQVTADLETGFNKYGYVIEKTGEVILTVNGQYLETESKSINPLALPDEILVNRFSTYNGAVAAPATVALTIDWLATLQSDSR